MKFFYTNLLIHIVITLFFLSNYNIAQEKQNDIIIKFKQEHNVSTMILGKYGTPTFIEGDLTPKGFKADNAEKSYKFFEENNNLFRMTDPRNELEIERILKDELGMTHIKFNQVYKGIQVYGNELITHFTPSGELKSINGSFVPEINVQTKPQINKSKAEIIGLADISKDSKDKPVTKGNSLIIYEFNETIYLAWLVNISVDNPPGNWEYFINALDGTIIYKANRIRYEKYFSEKEEGNNKRDSSMMKSAYEILQKDPSNTIIVDNIKPKTLEPDVVNQKGMLGWTTIMTETFEGAFPSGLWSSFPNYSAPSAFWDDQNYLKHGGGWSAWCASGGTQALPPSGGQYLDNMDAWMTYGPFDLTDAVDAELSFWCNYVTELNIDKIYCAVSTDDVDYSGAPLSGNSGGWINLNFDLSSFCGQPQVWIAFIFQSNGSNHNYAGAFVDDILLQKNTSSEQDSDKVATGTGVMGDQKNHIDTYGHTGIYQLLDRTRRLNNNPHNHNGQMDDNQVIETRMYPDPTPMTDDNNIWNNSSQASGVDAHVYAGFMYDFLLTQFGRNSYDNNGSGMLSIVEDNTFVNNAGWNGSKVTYYTVTSGHRSMAGAIDVVAHEWAHAVTENESGLIYEKEPGALDESFSDMIGTAVGFATGVDPDWQHGENFNTDGSPLRDLSNPHLGYRPQPDTYLIDDYWRDVVDCTPADSNDNCWIHYNSGVPNKMFYLLSQGGTHNGKTVTGIGISNAIKIMYRANAIYWTPNTDFINAKQGSISAANDLDPTGNWATQVQNSWEAVNVDVPTQEFTVTCSSNPINAGTTTGCGTYDEGSQATVVATANNGWSFVNWTENGNQVSTNNNYSFTVNSDRNLVANFTLTVSSSICIVPSTQTGNNTNGTLIPLDVQVGPVSSPVNFYGVSFNLSWQPSTYLEYYNSENGSWLGSNPVKIIQPFSDHIEAELSRTDGIGQTGTGVVLRCTLKVKENPPAGTELNLVLEEISALQSDTSPLNLNPCNVPAATVILENPVICVWPGDANNNGVVNVADVLPLGQFYNKTGTSRQSVSCSWIEQCINPWNPENSTYADCNGNGIVNAGDILCIGLNYGKTHGTLSKDISEPDSGLTIAKDNPNASILRFNIYDVNNKSTSINNLKNGDYFYLSVSVNTSRDIFGISLGIDWGNITGNPAALQVVEEWGENGIKISDIWGDKTISLGKLLPDEGRIDIGITRGDGISLNQQNTELVRIKMKVMDNTNIGLRFEDVFAINKNGDVLDVRGACLDKGLSQITEIAPSHYTLANYPNPFNPTTKIQVGLPEHSKVNLVVYNTLGEEIVKLATEVNLDAGVYEYTWDASSLPSGIYLYQLITDKYSTTKKMLLIK